MLLIAVTALIMLLAVAGSFGVHDHPNSLDAVHLNVTAQPAMRPPRVLRDQFDHFEPIRVLDQSLSDAEVQLAHRVGIGQRRTRERTGTQDDLHFTLRLVDGRIEPMAGHLIHQQVDPQDLALVAQPLTTTGPSPHLHRRVPGTDHLRQPQRETLVGARDSPPALRARVQLVNQSRSTAPTDRSLGLHDELRGDQLRQMLADRIVVQPEVLCQLSDIHRPCCVRKDTEDLVTRRIA